MEPHLYETIQDAVEIAAGVTSAQNELRRRGKGNVIVAELSASEDGVELLAVTIRRPNEVVSIGGTDFLTMGSLMQRVALTFEELE